MTNMAESQDSPKQMPRVLSGACDARQSTAGS
jgi:hypothetical protein